MLRARTLFPAGDPVSAAVLSDLAELPNPSMRVGLVETPLLDASTWARLNQILIARAISELSFEEAFAPGQLEPGGSDWRLEAGEGVSYRFAAVRRIWGNLAIDPQSLQRRLRGHSEPASDVALFMADMGRTLDVTPDTLAMYCRELYGTLHADAQVARLNAGISGEALLRLSDATLQQYLDGHPKAPACKGRIGWGAADAAAFAPEFGQEIRPMWIAADRDACRFSIGAGWNEERLLDAAFDGAGRARLEATLRRLKVDRKRYLLLPVHPWQWERMIVTQFAGEISARRLIPLGDFGDGYLALQSLRTLANASRPAALHLKLALTILNTSAWRGVPGKYMAIGPAFSAWLAAKTAADPALAGAIVLGEPAGAFYPHPVYERIDGAPYQFREMLGVIWREAVESHLRNGQSAMMFGALLKTMPAGPPLAAVLVARSGLAVEIWLARLFDAVVVPLYHFLCRYGVGFIAHGQNLTLILENFTPCGVAIKDLQGDVDLIDADFPEAADMPDGVRETLLRRPAPHLLQHLQTGHFVSVLRFLSDALAGCGVIDEMAFYAVLAERLRRYQASHPDMADRFALFNLFTPKVPRICINRVRLAIGYSDASSRPSPGLGGDLDNPLHFAPIQRAARAAAPGRADLAGAHP